MIKFRVFEEARFKDVAIDLVVLAGPGRGDASKGQQTNNCCEYNDKPAINNHNRLPLRKRPQQESSADRQFRGTPSHEQEVSLALSMSMVGDHSRG
jgi:hypothetical protein